MRQVNSKLTIGIYSLLPSSPALIRGIWSSTAAFVEIIVTESLSAWPRKLYCHCHLFTWPASRITPDNTVTQCSFRSLGPVLYLPFLVHIAVRSFFFLRWGWLGLKYRGLRERWVRADYTLAHSDHHPSCSTERANEHPLFRKAFTIPIAAKVAYCYPQVVSAYHHPTSILGPLVFDH